MSSTVACAIVKLVTLTKLHVICKNASVDTVKFSKPAQHFSLYHNHLFTRKSHRSHSFLDLSHIFEAFLIAKLRPDLNKQVLFVYNCL